MRSALHRRYWLLSALLLGGAVSCEPSVTQLVVVVSTIPAEALPLETVEVELRSADDLTTYDRARFALRTPATPGGHALPLSFGVAPRAELSTSRFRVVARGIWSDEFGAHRVETVALTSFSADQRLLLPLTLDVRCADRRDCAGETTCSELGCVSSRRDTSGLRALAPDESAPGPAACATSDAGCGDRCVEGTRVAVTRFASATHAHAYRRSGDAPPCCGFSVEDPAAFYLYATPRADLLPFYECRFSDGKHFYSTSPICEGNATSVGLLGYLLPPTTPARCGSVQLYRMYRGDPSDHVYTTDVDERDALTGRGYQRESVDGYVWTAP